MRFGSILSAAALLFSAVSAAPAPATQDTAASGIDGFSIGDIINALKIGLVQDIGVFITLDSLTTNIVSSNFTAKNPLPFELSIDRVVTSAGVNGEEYAKFDQSFSKAIVVPPLGTKNSGVFGNVLLTQGIDASLDIVPLGYLDLLNIDVYVRAGTIFGALGIPITISGVHQSNVPTTYTLDLS